MTQVCVFHISQFKSSLPSVSDVRKYLNVWSDSTKDKHNLIMSKLCDPFIHSLFHGVKMASARSRSSLPAEVLVRTLRYAKHMLKKITVLVLASQELQRSKERG
jgi:hypothetical protein